MLIQICPLAGSHRVPLIDMPIKACIIELTVYIINQNYRQTESALWKNYRMNY